MCPTRVTFPPSSDREVVHFETRDLRRRSRNVHCEPGASESLPAWGDIVRRLRPILLLLGAGILLAGCVAPTPPRLRHYPAPVPTPPPPHETIAFVSDRTGNPELWVMDADGSNQTQLTNDADIEREPKLSPDGTQIVFVRGNGRSGGFPDVPNEVIWVVNTDGSNAHSVFAPAVPNGGFTPPIVSNDRDPSWSPDGTQIAFYREGIGITMSGIMVMNADGSGARVVRPISRDSIRISQLAWSPGGTRIAYTYDYVCCSWHIVFVNADGSGPDFTPLIGPRTTSTSIRLGSGLVTQRHPDRVHRPAERERNRRIAPDCGSPTPRARRTRPRSPRTGPHRRGHPEEPASRSSARAASGR